MVKKNQRSCDNRRQGQIGSSGAAKNTAAPGPGTAMLRRGSLIILMAVITLAVSGCTYMVSTLIKSLPPASAGTSAETISTPAVTSTPAPGSTASMPEASLPGTPTPEVYIDQQQLEAAPEIAGLSKDYRYGEVIYKADDGNGYGIEAGQFAGVYHPNVFVEGEKIGCVYLIPLAAEKILNDQLEAIPAEELKLKILLPVEGDKRINISFEENYEDAKMIVINTDENADVYNICPDSDLYVRIPAEDEDGDVVYILNDSRALRYSGNPDRMLNDNAMYFVITTVAASDDFSSNDFFNAYFGDVFTQSNGKEIILWLSDESASYDLTLDDMVRTDDGVIVGIISAEE